jgi:predicted MFS family arabinose efflux permease
MVKEKSVLFTLAAIQFTHIMDFMIVMPLGPQLMRIFGINPQQFGFIVASYTFAAGICGFMGAFLIDRFDRRKALMFCYAGFTIGTIACALAPSYHFLLAARMLTGAFGGVTGTLVLSIIADLIPFERRSSAMGIVMMAFSVASVFGVPFGLYLSSFFNWHSPFLFLGGMGVVVFYFISRNIPSLTAHINKSENKISPLDNVKEILSDRNHLAALLVMNLLMIGQFSVIPYISAYMVSNVGFTELQLPYIYLLGGLASMVSMPLIGKLADRYGKIRIFTIFIFVSLLPIYFLTHLQQAGLPIALTVTTCFFIVMGGRMIPATTMITAAVVPQKRGSFMSLNTAVQQLSVAAASFMSGLIITSGPGGVLMNYGTVGIIAICSSLVCLYTARTLRARS